MILNYIVEVTSLFLVNIGDLSFEILARDHLYIRICICTCVCLCTLNGGCKVLEVGGKRVVKLIASPCGKHQEAYENAYGKTHSNG